MLTIVHVITSLNRGGAENHLYQLCSRQVKSGNKVCIVYMKGDGYWSERLTCLGVQVYSLQLISYFQIWKTIELRKIINRYSPDILHLHLPPAELYGVISSLFINNSFKTVITKHNDEKIAGNKMLDYLTQVLLDRADGIIHISEAVKTYFNKKNDLSLLDQRIIYYGIDVEDFEFSNSSNFRKEISPIKPRENSLTICTISRLVKQKRLDILIEAYASYRKKTKINSQLIIVGDGTLRKELEKLAEKLGVNQNIIWIAFTDNIPDLLSITDIFALTSEYEGLGLVLLEAMAAGRAVVASDVSAIPEIVIEGETGHLFPFGDVVKLCDLFLALESAKTRKRLGQQGKKRVQKQFSNEKMCENTINFYQEIIGKKN